MRIITLNVNGIRSATKKGFFNWVGTQTPDVICLQELKAHASDLTPEMLRPLGYHGYFHFAEKKGYSGVAIYSRFQPEEVRTGLGFHEADTEGRYVAIRLKNPPAHSTHSVDTNPVNDFWIASLYLPSGTSGPERQQIKFKFLDNYANHLKTLCENNIAHIICGDWNIAHKAIDLKNWRGNQKNSGFLPEERAWMESLFTEWGYIDAFRHVNPHPEQYTWWSNRGRAWEKNVGWRIDYQVLSKGLESKIKATNIFKDQRFSDHAPLIIDYEF